MKTIAPLHFEDLEPHRFEDLVRQLIYEFRPWRSLEAIGRLGADEGIDIRATENVTSSEDSESHDEAEEDGPPIAPPAIREWYFQCKRESEIGPTKLKQYVSESLDRHEEKPFGFVFAAACDFSKQSRDAFREEVAKRGTGEFYLWGKAELEDMLFRPQNDHLLFAYFGLSLQVRRRSMSSRLRSNLSLKRALVRHIGKIGDESRTEVLIRDPTNADYPRIRDVAEFVAAPSWRYWQFWAHEPVDHVAFIAHQYFAYFDAESGNWDALLDHDLAWPATQELAFLPGRWELEEAWIPSYSEKDRRYRAYWDSVVPSSNRATLLVLKKIPYARILALDELGDAYNRAPHLLVEFMNGQPFDFTNYDVIDGFGELHHHDPENRIVFFPDPVPEPRSDEPGA